MNILKIGDQYINWDQVTNVEFGRPGCTVYFSSQRDERPHLLEVRGSEMHGLRQWLDRHAQDVTNPLTAEFGANPVADHR